MKLQEYRYHYHQGKYYGRKEHEQWWGPPKDWIPTPAYADHVYWYNLGLPLKGINSMWYRKAKKDVCE